MVKKKKIDKKTQSKEIPPPLKFTLPAQKVLIILALFLPPLVFYPLWSEISHGKFISFQLIATLLFFLFLIEEFKSSRILFFRHPLNMPVIFYFTASLISISYAVNPLKSTDYLLKYFAFILFFFVVARAFRRIEDASRSIMAVYVSCFIVSCFGISQFIAWNVQDPEKANYPYYGSFFVNPNYAGQFVCIVLPLFLFCFSYFKKRVLIKCSILFGFLVMGFYLIITFARGAWLSAFFGFVVIICTGIYLKVERAYGSKGVRNYWISLIALILFGLSVLVFLWVGDFSIYSVDFILKRGVEVESTEYGFINSRLLLWSDSLNLIKSNFPKGAGLGNFEFEIPKFQKFFPNAAKYQYAHSDFIQKACEEGPLGLFAFLWLLASLFKALFSLIRRTTGVKRSLFLSLLGSVSAMSFFALLDFPFFEPAPLLVFWLSAGIVASHISSPLSEREPGEGSYFQIKMPSFLIILLAIIFAISFGKYLFHYAGGGYLFQKGKSAKQAQKALDYYEKSLNLWDHEYQTHFELGKQYYLLGNFTKAESELKEALKLHPYHWNSLGNIGVLYLNLYEKKKNHPDRERFLETAYRYIKKSNEINPKFNLNNLGLIYYYKGEYIRAGESFEKEVEVFPNDLFAYFWGGRTFVLAGNYLKAEKFFRRAVELNPDNFGSLFEFSEVLFKNGKYEESYDILMRALEIKPNYKPAENLRNMLIKELMRRR